MPSYKQGTPESGGGAKFVEPGRYHVEVIDAEEKLSKAGNDMIRMKISERHSGARFTENLVFVETAFWKIDQYRAAVGEKVAEGEDVDLFASEQIGKRAVAILGTEDGSNGKTYNRIESFVLPEDWEGGDAEWVNSGGGASGDDCDGTEDDIPF